MPQNFRHPEILRLARADGKVVAEDLSARFGVSVQTIRRDLSDLAEAGQLERVHGGAILPSGVSNIAYEERRRLNQIAKTAIGRACAAQVPDGASVFLGIGTTTEAVAHELKGHRSLMAVTNNLNIAPVLQANSDCEVMVTGGALRRADAGLVGPMAEASVHQFRFDIAIIGCSAIDGEGDMLDFDLAEVEISRVLLAQSRKVMLVADHSKFQRKAPVRIGALRDLDVVFTDAELAGELPARCREWQTDVRICK